MESVCDETRVAFLRNWRKDSYDEDDKVRAFRDQIETEDYSSLLESFRKIMGARKVVMFQTRTQDDLTAETEHRSITVLASSQEENDQMDILRSELLDFYCRHTPCECRPFSKLLLEVKDTVRIVSVGEKQVDYAVQEYIRQPCTIAYVRLDYTDRLRVDKPGRVFFAFFYAADQSKDLMEVLKHLQGFLSFRHNLKQRIEKDFSGNIFGKRAEETWRIDWLSIEKAGSHTDSSGVNRLIKHRPSNSNIDIDIMDTLFNPSNSMPEDSGQLLKLTYNILIAMYFRAVISAGQDQFISADNLDDGDKDTYCKVGDLIPLSEKNYEKFKLRFAKGQNEEYINNAPLYGVPNKITTLDGRDCTGIPAYKGMATRRKYLQAFVVDILCNIENHGTAGEYAEIYIEDCPDPPGYLVFKNQVTKDPKDSKDPETWCRQKNYELKRSIEFDHMGASGPKGFSLGCIAHCMRWIGNLVARYSCENGKIYFTIKLPIIQLRKEESDING